MRYDAISNTKTPFFSEKIDCVFLFVRFRMMVLLEFFLLYSLFARVLSWSMVVQKRNQENTGTYSRKLWILDTLRGREELYVDLYVTRHSREPFKKNRWFFGKTQRKHRNFQFSCENCLNVLVVLEYRTATMVQYGMVLYSTTVLLSTGGVQFNLHVSTYWKNIFILCRPIK